MKRILLPLLFTGLMFKGVSYAQSNSIPLVNIDAPNMEAIQAEDEERGKNGLFYRIGVHVPVNINFFNQGLWYNDENGNLVGSIQIKVPGAQALSLIFDEFTLPTGAEVRLYHPETNQLIGPYNNDNNIEDETMNTGMVHGEELILEVVVPEESAGELKLHIKQVGYFYRNTDPFAGMETRDFGDSESCEVNVACSEGASSTNQSAGVCRILVTDGSGSGWCSGSLINNTANDCTPYVLTAQHCGAGATAAQFRSWVFYFKYESSTCSNPPTQPTSFNVTGSVKVASSGTTSTVSKSDYLLLIIKARPAAGANAYYNGWNRNTTVSGGGKGIHHPAGDIKKISTYSSTPTQSTWSGSGVTNGHWRVTWVSTANGHGVTEGGSSGSPLFNSSGLIIGDLSGGSSFCTSPSSPDLYGKFSYSWNSCGATPQLQLAPWLDRSSTGATTLTGKAQSTCSAATLPVVEFSASNLFPVVNEVVTLSDESTNSPFYWQWVITPTTFVYTGGTNAFSQNPQVQFTATGNYTVILHAANTAGYNFRSKGGYIHVGGLGIEDENTPQVTVYPNPASDVLFVNITNSVWDFEKTTISMMDLSGKYVMVEKVSTVNASTISVDIPSSIASGFYMVQISDGVNSTTKKIEIIK